jgi:hypothetical protein
MILPSFRSGSATTAPRRRTEAYTLVEMLVAVGAFSLVAAGLLSAHIFGLRQNQIVGSKLGASDLSRRVLGTLAGEIRAAQILRIGNGNAAGFTPLTNGVPQVGNALQLCLTADTNTFVRYYFETNNARLCRMTSSWGGYNVIADHLTNSMYFRSEDYLGNLVTEPTYKYVVQVCMEFCQFQYPLTRVGPGYYYDSYRLQLKVTPHCPSLQ